MRAKRWDRGAQRGVFAQHQRAARSFVRDLRREAAARGAGGAYPVHLGSLPWGLRRTLERIATTGEAMRPGISGSSTIRISRARTSTTLPSSGRSSSTARSSVMRATKRITPTSAAWFPGSMPPSARELFAEGFIMPPMRLMRDDAVVPDTVALFRANSRTPETRSGDLRAQLAGNVTANAGCANWSIATARPRSRMR